MIIQAYFGSAQTGLGYQFFDQNGTLIGARITAGISSLPEVGAYIADAIVPESGVGVFWDSNETPTGASEDLREALSQPAIPTAAQVADAVWDEDLTDHALPGTTGDQLAAAGASGDPWATLVPGDYADGTAGSAVGRLNNTPAENPIAIVPAPTGDPDLAVVYVDTEDMLGQVITDAVIMIELISTQPAKTAQGRIVGNQGAKMPHDADTPGRYQINLETGLRYRAKCLELFGPNGKTFTLAAGAENLNLAD